MWSISPAVPFSPYTRPRAPYRVCRSCPQNHHKHIRPLRCVRIFVIVIIMIFLFFQFSPPPPTTFLDTVPKRLFLTMRIRSRDPKPSRLDSYTYSIHIVDGTKGHLKKKKSKVYSNIQYVRYRLYCYTEISFPAEREILFVIKQGPL